MSLNKRHKAILFITLVMTGSALLAGAKLSEGVGILILGVAFAWLFGSETASRTYDSLRSVPGRAWPWLRISLLMVTGGALLVGVALVSNFNSFIVVASLCIFGVLISPIRQLPTQRRWLVLLVWFAAVVVFFLSAVGVSVLCHVSSEESERVGELTAYGLIAFPIGMLWLVKGWRLIVAGITAQQVVEPASPESTPVEQKGTRWRHVFLFSGVLVLTLWLGLLTFSAFSDSVYPYKTTSSSKPTTIGPVLFLLLLAWWPYVCWASILRLEPNTSGVNLRRHKRVTMALGALFTVIMCVAITFGIQNGNDRVSTAKIEEGRKDFQDVAVKIGGIKSRELRTTKDYIDAYAEMEPLLAEFDGQLRQFTIILNEAQQEDTNRGPLNVRHLFRNNEKEMVEWDFQTFELLRQDNELTRKQILVTKQMAALPQEYQVEFWKKNFQPLAEEEDILRQKIAEVMKGKPK
ncbi:MAG: hypothetical protein ABR920_09640 [Terriglobales bacterium]